ncbi:MAG: hypothetical protein ACLGH7_14885, partial [Actinomycetes bacterium]
MLLLIPMTSSSPDPGFLVTQNDAAGQVTVTDSSGRLLATFTYGARTVTLAGAQRTFAEDTAAAPVVSSIHVRLLPEAFKIGR